MRFPGIALILLLLSSILFSLTHVLFAQPRPPILYEIWVTDQANDVIYIFNGISLKRTDTISVDDDDQPKTSKPHTISFSPDGQYAYVANVGAKKNTNNVVVIRTSDRKIVSVIPAGPNAHMVLASSDGTRVYVTNAGGDSVLEIVTDLENGEFKPGRIFNTRKEAGVKSHPTCLALSSDDKKLYVTNAGNPKDDPSTSGYLTAYEVSTGRELFRLTDLDSEVCGLARYRGGRQMYLLMGGTSNTILALDTVEDRIIKKMSTAGQDSHGLAITPGGHQVWITDRMSGNLTVLSTTTGMHIKTHFKVGDRSDLIDFSPDGSRGFVTLRGIPVTPIPNSKPGIEPGLLVFEVDTGKILKKIPIQGDPHGIAVRKK